MKKSVIKISLILLAIIVVSSCKKSDKTGISLSFIGSTPALKSAQATGFSFSEARIGLHEIEVELESEVSDGMETEVEFDYEGEYNVNLLTGLSSPEIGFTGFEPGLYNEVKAELRPLLDNRTKSIILKGSFTDAEMVVTNFEFSTAAEIEFKVESSTGFYLEEGNILDIVVKINLPGLFEGVSFAGATVNGQGVVVIDDQTNTALSAAIKANLLMYAEVEEEIEHD